MAAIVKWEKDIGQMTKEKIERMIKSLDVLATWELFFNQYRDMILLKTILHHELDKRGGQ